MVTIHADIRIESEANRREHWAPKRIRRLHQQAMIAAVCREQRAAMRALRIPLRITFTRFGPRRIDSDNLANGFKACRDALMRWIGDGTYDDGDESIEWCYQQVANGQRIYAVRIELTPVSQEEADRPSFLGGGIRLPASGVPNASRD